MEQLEVNVVSRETLKPSSPKISHKKTFTLSLLEQAFPCVHTTFCLVYNTNNHYPSVMLPSHVDIINTLKSCLSETLTVFYPLAGRFENESTVSCNDEGALFIETHVNSLLSTVLNSQSTDHGYVSSKLGQLLPPSDVLHGGGRPITEVVPLAFQINVFLCGGIVIGCYMIHKLLDAASMSTFLNYWAALVKSNKLGIKTADLTLLTPDFKAVTEAFPPAPRNVFTDHRPSNHNAINYALIDLKVVAKSFLFNKLAIEKLKIKAASEKLPDPTGFEAVTAFIWHHAFPAKSKEMSMIDSSVCSFAANIRSRTCPPLPKGAMGNLVIVVNGVARVEQEDTNKSYVDVDEIPRLAAKIRAAKVAKVDERVEELQRVGVQALLQNEGHEMGEILEGGSFVLSSWCKLGLSDVDFGFGKPNRIIPIALVHPVLKNHVFLVDYADQSGHLEIDAWLFLEEKEMKLLESDSRFCEFTCSI